MAKNALCALLPLARVPGRFRAPSPRRPLRKEEPSGAPGGRALTLGPANRREVAPHVRAVKVAPRRLRRWPSANLDCVAPAAQQGRQEGPAAPAPPLGARGRTEQLTIQKTNFE